MLSSQREVDQKIVCKNCLIKANMGVASVIFQQTLNCESLASAFCPLVFPKSKIRVGLRLMSKLLPVR
jgi:hypothetical protein